MIASQIVEFLEGQISGNQLHALLLPEVQNYRERTATKAQIIPLAMVSDLPGTFIVAEKHIARLCDSFVTGLIDAWDVAYFCEVLELSESFKPSSSRVEDVLARLGNPALFGMITIAKCEEIKSALER